MVLLSKTRSKIFLLLVLLMGGQDLQRILGLICFGVSVGNTNIQDTISATGPEATDKKITTVITGRGWCQYSICRSTYFPYRLLFYRVCWPVMTILVALYHTLVAPILAYGR